MSDNVYFVSDKIEVRKSSIHGLGVFAKENIPADTVIEISRLLRLGWRMAYQNDPVIRDYCWGNLGWECEQCKIHGPHSYLALGYGSLYNHMDSPNTNMSLDFNHNTMMVKTKRDINKDEELFVCYGENYWKHRSKSLTKKDAEL